MRFKAHFYGPQFSLRRLLVKNYSTQSQSKLNPGKDPIQWLQGRGLIQQLSSSPEALIGQMNHKNEKPASVYVGVDPTAPSLHVGHLLSILSLMQFWRSGYHVLALIGGATASIGDPSGRRSERPVLEWKEIESHAQSIHQQIQKLFSNQRSKWIQEMEQPDAKPVPAESMLTVVNNADWIRPLSLLDFMKEMGKYTRISDMMSRESVRQRLRSEHGISYLEFSYQLLQAWDFWHLFRKYNCRLQLGGGDQWGNIISGVEFIHKRCRLDQPDTADQQSHMVFGLTTPLLLTKSGEKFGKSAGNAVWLDSSKTTPYDFYQFFMRADDEDVETLLKNFTFMEMSEIDNLMAEHSKNPQLRKAQSVLATDVTSLVHGPEIAAQTESLTKLLFPSQTNSEKCTAGLTVDDIDKVIAGLDGDPRLVRIRPSERPDTILDVLLLCGGVSSKNKARALVKSGGIYLNNHRVVDGNESIGHDEWLAGKLMTIRVGKSNFRFLQLVE